MFRSLGALDPDSPCRAAVGGLAHGRLEAGVGMNLQEYDDAIIVALIEYLRSSHDALAGAHAFVLVDVDLDHLILP
jgi:hypothetical protein